MMSGQSQAARTDRGSESAQDTLFSGIRICGQFSAFMGLSARSSSEQMSSVGLLYPSSSSGSFRHLMKHELTFDIRFKTGTVRV
jgi:hypothetical protein